jgi:hypothetical protein
MDFALRQGDADLLQMPVLISIFFGLDSISSFPISGIFEKLEPTHRTNS